jgi:hypothetical protein
MTCHVYRILKKARPWASSALKIGSAQFNASPLPAQQIQQTGVSQGIETNFLNTKTAGFAGLGQFLPVRSSEQIQHHVQGGFDRCHANGLPA